MRTLVVGGTGLLGHATGIELLRQGHSVTLAGLAPADLPGVEGADWWFGDLHGLADEALLELLSGFDAMVYALGPDDREHVAPPASAFFQRALVDASARIVGLARRAGVRRAVVCSSYFVSWARTHPGFAERHPYVQARVDQKRRCVEEAGETLTVSFLEIPYVFGHNLPGRPHQWRELLFDRVRSGPFALYPVGGTTVTSVETVARAAVAALGRAAPGETFPVGDADMTWAELVGEIRAAMGRSRTVIGVPRWLAEPQAAAMGRQLASEGLDSGLDPAWLMRDLMYQRMFVDHAGTRTRLGLPVGDVIASIRDSVADAYPPDPALAQG